MRLPLFFGIVILLACNKVADTPPTPPTPDTTPPTAVAGPDTTFRLPTDSVLLDGSKSTGQAGIELAFTWTKLDGAPGDIIVYPHAKSTIVKHLSAGTYHYKLKVCANNLCSEDAMRVTVTDVDLPPIANAGNDTTVAFGTPLELNGSKSSDPEGKMISYAWKMLDGHALDNTITDSTMQVTTAKIFEIGIFHFELKVIDSIGQISRDTVAVTVGKVDGELTWTKVTTTPTGGAFSFNFVAAAGNKLVGISTLHYQSIFYFYDVVAGTWQNAGGGGGGIGIVAQGSKIYFMGGGQYGADTNTLIRIYDASSEEWSEDHLPTPHIFHRAYSTDNFVFIGGAPYADILNTTNHIWSNQMLGWVLLGFDNKIYGYTGGQNVFDMTTSQYTSVSFPPSFYQGAHNGASSVTTSNTAFFLDAVNQEIYSLRKGDNQWNLFSLPQGSDVSQATSTIHEVFFWPSTNTGFINVFDEITSEWKAYKSSLPAYQFLSLNNDIYATNGLGVWKLNR